MAAIDSFDGGQMSDGNFSALHCFAGGQSVEGSQELCVSQGADSERGRCRRLRWWPGYEFAEVIEVNGFEISLRDGTAGLGASHRAVDGRCDDNGASQQWRKQPGVADGM